MNIFVDERFISCLIHPIKMVQHAVTLSAAVVWGLRVDVRESTYLFLSLHNSINSTTIFKHFAELSRRSGHQGLVCGQSAWIWMWSSIRPLVIFILRHGNHSYSRLQPDRFWSGVLKKKLHKCVLSRGFPLIGPDGWVGECCISHTGDTKNNNGRNKKS